MNRADIDKIIRDASVSAQDKIRNLIVRGFADFYESLCSLRHLKDISHELSEIKKAISDRHEKDKKDSASEEPGDHKEKS